MRKVGLLETHINLAPIKTVLAVFKSNDLTEQFPQVEEITQVKLFCKSGRKSFQLTKNGKRANNLLQAQTKIVASLSMVKARNMFLCSSCNKYDANKTKKQRFYAVVFLLPLF